jgi:bifunctional DNA-binding transcriptional regulator/antitoxin component of YhaV-PrlF toxin-antitoxin module
MNVSYTQLSKKGLITIPQEIRKALGLDAKKQPLLRLTQRGGTILIEPVKVIPAIDLRVYSDKEVDEFIKEDRLTVEEKKDAERYLKNLS